MKTNSLTVEAVVGLDDRLTQFRSVYETYEPWVRKTLFWLVSADAVDDLVQETFIRVWEKASQFREESTLKTWIYRITVNLAYDYFRSAKSQKRSDEAVRKDYELSASAAPSGEGGFVAHELIQKGVRLLSAKERSVFVLFYKQELSIDEIAATLELPAGTVKFRLFHARETFIEYLKKNGVTHERV